MSKTDIRTLSDEAILREIMATGLPAFRARQIIEWLWKKQAVSFDQMTNLSKDLRAQLNEQFEIRPIAQTQHQKSVDGTIKAGFSLHDGHVIEGVLIPARDRVTACISSQVGCTFSCKFCATGFLKRERNLEAAEIYDQVVMLNRLAEQHYERGITNIVYMGMGEPLMNYENVMRSVELITGEGGLHMSAKRITVSTVGVVRNILKLAEAKVRFNLALSLHAATDEKRLPMMAVTKSNPLDKVIEALNIFYRATRNKITFEYVMLKDVNDSDDDLSDLIRLCKRVPAFVNLIEFNTVEQVPYEKTDKKRIEEFAVQLEMAGVNVRVRMSRGEDIDAACGQLANKV